MKISFLIRSLNIGGAERQLTIMAKELKRRGRDVTVLTFYSGGFFESELLRSGITVVSLQKKNRWDILPFTVRLLNALRRIKPDILYTHLSTPNLLSILLKPFLNPTRVIWGIRNADLDFTCYDWMEKPLFYLQCFFSRFADQIIFNSYAGKRYHLSKGFPADRSAVISNGIDTAVFKPDREGGVRVRNEWKIQEKELVIGLVGKLNPIKGHEIFLQAIPLFIHDHRNVKFVLIGSGDKSYRETLKKIAQSLQIENYLIWADSRVDINTAYNALDILTSCSLSEGFSNVIGEAMACGVPCVVTDVGDSAQIVGEMGIAVAPQEPKGLAQGWRQLSGLITGEFKNRVRNRIVQEFSVEKLAERTLQALWPKV